MHAQFLHQLAFAGDAAQVADQQDAQQQLGVDRRAARLSVTVLQLLAHKAKAEVLFDEPQQMSFWNLIFQTEIVKQGFGTIVLPHHDQRPSENGDPAEHGKDFFLVPRFCRLSAC